jgi:pilus assembly protein Flp/PilA
MNGLCPFSPPCEGLVSAKRTAAIVFFGGHPSGCGDNLRVSEEAQQVLHFSGKEVSRLQYRTLDRAQGLVEYALILVLVVLVVFVALVIFGPMLGNVFSGINSSLSAT